MAITPLHITPPPTQELSPATDSDFHFLNIFAGDNWDNHTLRTLGVTFGYCASTMLLSVIGGGSTGSPISGMERLLRALNGCRGAGQLTDVVRPGLMEQAFKVREIEATIRSGNIGHGLKIRFDPIGTWSSDITHLGKAPASSITGMLIKCRVFRLTFQGDRVIRDVVLAKNYSQELYLGELGKGINQIHAMPLEEAVAFAARHTPDFRSIINAFLDAPS